MANRSGLLVHRLGPSLNQCCSGRTSNLVEIVSSQLITEQGVYVFQNYVRVKDAMHSAKQQMRKMSQ